MVKDDTIIILAVAGIAGYGLLKSGFFEGIGQVGSGVGDVASNIGNFTDPLGALGSSSSDEIRARSEIYIQEIIRESEQRNIIDTQAFNLSQEAETQAQAGADINEAVSKANRRMIRQDILTKLNRFPQFELEAIKGLFYDVPYALGQKFAEQRSQQIAKTPFSQSVVGSVLSNAFSSEFSKALRRDAPISFTTEAATGGNITLPSGGGGGASVSSLGGGIRRVASSTVTAGKTGATTIINQAKNIRSNINQSIPTPASVISRGVSAAKSLLRRLTGR